MSAAKISALQFEEIGLLRKLEETREQIRLLSASESILQGNLNTTRAKLAGVALARAAAEEAEPPRNAAVTEKE